MANNEIKKAQTLIKKLEEAYNAYYDTSKGMPYDIDTTLRESAICLENSLNEINRLEADKEALIAGQETLQKALAEKNAEIEKQSQNFKVLVSDHRTLQQSFDNLKGLYEDEKSKVKKAKEKCIYFIKKLQKAEAETDRVTALAAEWKDAAYTYADSIDRVKAEAITYAMEWLQANHYINHSPERRKQFVKEMVGE